MPKPRNVLVLMCDHHRYDALGCLGNPLARTPNLDRLAARSVRFENCYTQSPVCAPARHSLATGRYAHAHGVITNNHQPHPGLFTIAHALEPLGYRRMQLGHMHWKDLEMDTGYEPWITHESWRTAMPPDVIERHEWEGQGVTRRTTAGPSPRSREQYTGHFVAKNTIREIESAVAQGQNFLCWAAFSEPHPPFYPPRDIYEAFDQSAIRLPQQAPADAAPPHDYILSKREEWAHLTGVEIRQIIAGYYGMVTLVDEYLGRVLDALERLGVREDTIVIWTSDHGDQMWEHELFLKFNMYEGSVHVPLLIDVPGGDPAVRGELVEHIDVFPTVCDLLGVPRSATVQGRSLISLLDGGPTPRDWRDAVFSQIGNVQMMRTRESKLNVYDGEPGELYDLRTDPNEFHNRVADSEQADAIRPMMARLREWEQGNQWTAG